MSADSERHRTLVLWRHMPSLALAVPYLLGLLLDSAWLIWTPAIVFSALIPVLDRWLSSETRTEEAAGALTRYAPHMFLVLQAACVLGAVAFLWRRDTVAGHQLAGLVFSLGLIGSIGVSASHELVHKPEGVDKRFGRFGFALVFHTHFETTHLHGHHSRACTAADASTALYGESLYRYLVRTTVQQVRFTAEYERSRYATLSARLASSQLVRDGSLYVAAALLAFASPTASLALFGHAVIARIVLESVAYIEHYGLLRATSANERPVPMAEEHSWDVYLKSSSHLAFMLQRHADHHIRSTRWFFRIRESHIAAELPHGYPVMIPIALVPPLWRRIIHPILSVHVQANTTTLQPLPIHRESQR